MDDGILLSKTVSLCPECLRRIPAKRIARGDTVYMEKTCPEHGAFRTKIWQGLPTFTTWVRPKIPGKIQHPYTEVKRGCPYDCGLCPSHRQHTCTAVIEVTQRCNLHCTFCFADAGGESQDPDLETVRSYFQSLLDGGGTPNVQISGGEPTMRDDLPEIVAMGHEMGFPFIQLNTNGLRLSRDRRYLEALRAAGLDSIFLQFDGTEPEIFRKMRGGDYLSQKLDTIRQCGELGIGVVLVPTVVPGVNDHNIGSLIQLALEWMPAVKGVHFQPASYFGRVPHAPTDEERITLPEVLQRMEEQTAGLIKMENFRPSGCENAMCSFHGNFILMAKDEVMAITKHDPAKACCAPPEEAVTGAKKAREFVSTHWAVTGSATDGCGCFGSCDSDAEYGANEGAGAEPGSLDFFLERARSYSLTISGMAFMDAWNFDLERIMDCCIHTVAPDGKVIPFCAYNVTDRNGNSLYRGQVAP